jgi:hypothetical protein
VFLRLNEFETGKVVRVNVSNMVYYKTIRVQRGTSGDRVEATGIRIENDPIMLVVTETVEQIDDLLKESYHYIK